MRRSIKFLWRLAEAASTAIWAFGIAGGTAVTVIAIAFGWYRDLPVPLQFVLFVVAYCVAGGMAMFAFWSFRERQERRREALRSEVRRTSWAGPSNREELCVWLQVRIEEIVAWRAILDEEVAKPVPSIDRTDSIQAMFWEGLNRDVARMLHLLAPEWVDYWNEEPEWFFSQLTRITSEQFAEFSRLLGWEAERLRHIKRELRA